MAVNFIGGRNRRTRRKPPTCLNSLTNCFVKKTLENKMMIIRLLIFTCIDQKRNLLYVDYTLDILVNIVVLINIWGWLNFSLLDLSLYVNGKHFKISHRYSVSYYVTGYILNYQSAMRLQNIGNQMKKKITSSEDFQNRIWVVSDCCLTPKMKNFSAIWMRW